MDYVRQYKMLIAKHGTEEKPEEGYTERHHVIPRSLGGSDDSSNLVYLSAKAHYLSHYLLYKIHGEGPMAHAFWMMSAMDTSGQRHVPNSRSFSTARTANATASSAALSGISKSDDTKARMSEAKSGAKHPQAKRADIFEYTTGNKIAQSVIIAEWIIDREYCKYGLRTTARADRSKPVSQTNRLHHKGIYAVYV
tara:strand:+ start:161 stop:745 length:585 start_codon:yes stop_codon:yes gene_type:complete